MALVNRITCLRVHSFRLSTSVLLDYMSISLPSLSRMNSDCAKYVDRRSNVGDRIPCHLPTPNSSTMYDARKYGHEITLKKGAFPNIFRNTDGEVPRHGKADSFVYKNPEYYSYQHMSYYDVEVALIKMRFHSRTSRCP